MKNILSHTRVVLFITLAFMLPLKAQDIGDTTVTDTAVDSTIELDDFKVNDDYGTASQSNPKIAVSGDRSFIVTWVDRRNGNADIYMQKFNPNCERIGRNIKINDDTNNSYQSYPAVGIDLFGRFSLTWLDYRDGSYPSTPNIYFQGFDTSIQFTGQNKCLTDPLVESIKEAPDISFSHTGDGVVVWADYRTGNWDIYGQRFRYDGTLIGENFVINDDTVAAQQHAPMVSMAPDGWFVVTWYDNRKGNEDIFVQRYDKFGNKAGSNTLVIQDTFGFRQSFPDIATDGAGHFTVVWVDWRNGDYPQNPDIYSRKYDTLMVPVTAEIRMNSDNAKTAQREAVIAADRMGNVAIIWADSTQTSWDITGQMIDVEGNVRESNFLANSYDADMQFDPDVALDGIYRYIVWSDKRNGNFDIYISVVKYNDPTLIATPQSVKFQMPIGGPIPFAQEVMIDHGGYNRLDFEIHGGDDWLNVTPRLSQTPDTIILSINTDTLPFGKYQTSLMLIDTLNHDSTSMILVELDVTAPVLSLSVDSLHFTKVSGIASSVAQQLRVNNNGTGALLWNAVIDSNWITINTATGTAPSIIDVNVNHLGLDTGAYYGSIIINAPGAMDAPDTVYVAMEILPNHPYISVTPDSLYADIINRNMQPFQLTVANTGTGILNWQASTDATWLRLDRTLGGNNSLIGVSIIADSMINGRYISHIKILDTAATNDSVMVPVVIDWMEYAEFSLLNEQFYIYSYNPPPFDTFTVILNSGYGHLNWIAMEEIPWLNISPVSGTDEDTLFISVTDPTIVHGIYTSYIEITDATAVNSPVMLPFTFHYHDQSEISASPTFIIDSLKFENVLDTFIVINNLGGGVLNWQASTNTTHITLTPQTGGNSGTVRILYDTLPPGTYMDTIQIMDIDAVNSPYKIPLNITIAEFQNEVDTVYIESAQIRTGQTGKIGIGLDLTHNFSRMHLPLSYESDKIQIDSIVPITTMPQFSFINYNVNNISNTIVINLLSNNSDSLFDSTFSQMCHVFFSALDYSGDAIIGPVVSGDSAYLIDDAKKLVFLDIIPGSIRNDVPTSTNDVNLELPDELVLYQNYPNPFNLETTISFDLPGYSDINLEIYNVLGQKVQTIMTSSLPAGSYVVFWDGRFKNGLPAPSGIYFYRLVTGYGSLVKKMTVIK